MKAPKKRNKKYIPPNPQRALTHAIYDVINSVYFMGDHRHVPIAIADSALTDHVTSQYYEAALRAMAHLTVTEVVDWSLWVMAVVKRGDQIEVLTGRQIVSKLTFQEMGNVMMTSLHTTLRTLLAEAEIPAEALHGYGYFLDMGNVYDIDQMEDRLINQFLAIGVGDDQNDLQEEELVDYSILLAALLNTCKGKAYTPPELDLVEVA